jgi:hypothetical protein
MEVVEGDVGATDEDMGGILLPCSYSFSTTEDIAEGEDETEIAEGSRETGCKKNM